MISFSINKVPVLFIRAFSANDVRTIVEFVRSADAARSQRSETILFVDTPETGFNVDAVRKLKADSYRVIYRDHHEIEGEPLTEGDRRAIESTTQLRALLGDDCTISNRSTHPACSTLVKTGEFANAAAIIADPDADGLTAAMKAAGLDYPELDDDAAKLDGEPFYQVTGSDISKLLAKGVACLPKYDSSNPDQREKAQEQLFKKWVRAVQGDLKALEWLQQTVLAYDAAVVISQDLAKAALAIAPGVVLVDTAGSPLYDPGTLLWLLEQRPGCRITVLRRDNGPLASMHQFQYSLAVAKLYQSTVNLKQLLPSHFKTDLQAGVITNVSFLLHVSEQIWNEYVLPALLQTNNQGLTSLLND